MDINDEFRKLSVKVKSNIEKANTEEAIKNLSVLPFLQILGYDIFDPNEVCPEYTSNVGIKTSDKVDYCILIENKPVLLLECKAKDKNLEYHKMQLFKYYSPSSVRFAILTNGSDYQFFTDIEKQNIMDSQPFWVIDILNLKEEDFLLLEKKF